MYKSKGGNRGETKEKLQKKMRASRKVRLTKYIGKCMVWLQLQCPRSDCNIGGVIGVKEEEKTPVEEKGYQKSNQ